MFLSTLAAMPLGSANTTGCEKPSARFSFWPVDLGAVTDAVDLELALEARR